MKLRLLALAAFFLLAKNAPAQDAATLKKTGEDLLATGRYRQALVAFRQSEKKQANDAETRTNIGICYFHLHRLDSAEAALFHAFHAKNDPPPTAFLYLGKLRHAELKFEQAVDFYKRFLRNTPASHPPKGASLRAAVKDDIRRCATGLRVRRLESPAAAVVPLGDAVNTPGDEFRPLPSPSGYERLYFSATRSAGAASDIFFTEINNGDWAAPVPLSNFVNSAENEVALGFDEGGSRLFFFRGKTQRSGGILVDTFRENALERTLFFEEFTGPMRPAEGDCAPFFFNDTILLFASRRAGGFGGLDLYVSTFTKNTWTLAENLGPVVNSAYDDTSPFLARDGRTLYFATNDVARSCGGLDLLTTTWLDWSGRWSPPVNLGLPLNSAADDEHFTFNQSGGRAFFSSSRKTGPGQRDLYVALFNPPREEQLGESLPVAFHLKPSPAAAASEAAVQSSGNFFEEISSFELPVITLPAVGGTPSEQAVQQFSLLAQLMKKYPQAQVTLALHSAPGDDPVPFFSFAAQTATDLLRQEGVGLENVVVLFAGSSYPLDGSSRRAEIYLANPAVLPFELYRPQLPTDAFNARFFQKTMTSLAYRVAASPFGVDSQSLRGGQPAPSGWTVGNEVELRKLFELYPDGLLEFRPSEGKLHFTSGLYLTFASAEEWRKNLVRDGYREARVAAYLNGREVSKEEAARHLDDFPDLRNFIEN